MGNFMDDDVAPTYRALTSDRIVAIEDCRGRFHATTDTVGLHVGKLFVGIRADGIAEKLHRLFSWHSEIVEPFLSILHVDPSLQ